MVLEKVNVKYYFIKLTFFVKFCFKLSIDTYFIVGNGPQPSAKGKIIPDESG